MRIIPLEREKYDYYELHYSYDTDYHYTVDVKSTAAEMGMILKREKYAETRHVENTDTLYQDYWTGARAFAVCPDGSDEHIGYVEIATEEWNNRLRMSASCQARVPWKRRRKVFDELCKGTRGRRGLPCDCP